MHKQSCFHCGNHSLYISTDKNTTTFLCEAHKTSVPNESLSHAPLISNITPEQAELPK